MEDVEVGVGSGKVQLKVFGHGNTARLTTAINSTVAILRTSVAVCLVGAFLGAFAWHYIVGMFF
jgi:predicted neutral ceramidase superfamily lipid hydrolase